MYVLLSEKQSVGSGPSPLSVSNFLKPANYKKIRTACQSVKIGGGSLTGFLFHSGGSPPWAEKVASPAGELSIFAGE
jgi:hypothetical protein